MKHTQKLPPFTRALIAHGKEKNCPFATPGHHEGDFFRRTKEGRPFYKALGPALFRLDVSDSDCFLGDPSSHEGLIGDAEKRAAQVFHADRAWFVTGGTSASNRIVCQSLLSEKDLVLFDRNNHKSVYQGALLQAGATPIYLPSLRNERGMIGGVPAEALSETAIRKAIARVAPDKAKEPRPFRLACLQLCTYDGIFASPAFLLERLGPLCEYILFDAAWAGYEPWTAPLRQCSPLTLPLTEKSPGLLVTQSVHKQLAGFSQTSQILKKDSHIKDKSYYLPDDALDSVFLMNSSTSPYFPLLAGLEMNVFLHEKEGDKLWKRAVDFGITLREEILSRCRFIRPFLPSEIDGKPWISLSKKKVARSPALWSLSPAHPWHGFTSLQKNQYLLDPCKVLLMTDAESISIPAPLLSLYLQDHQITPEKNDWYSLLFLAEPGDNQKKASHLAKTLAAFEDALEANRTARDIIPSFTGKGRLQDVTGAINYFLASHHAVALQKKMFESLPRRAMSPKEAHQKFLRREGKLMPLKELAGMTALECVLPYPPGIVAVNAGEMWTEDAVKYFLCLKELSEKFPAMAPEMSGLHALADEENQLAAYVE